MAMFGLFSNFICSPFSGLQATYILAFERHLAMYKMGGVHVVMHFKGQHPLKQASLGMGVGATKPSTIVISRMLMSLSSLRTITRMLMLLSSLRTTNDVTRLDIM